MKARIYTKIYIKILWAIVAVSMLAGVNCSKKDIRAYHFVCTMHGVHNCYNKADIARCIGVDEPEIDNYYIFSESGTGSDISMLESRLKTLVCDKIVDEVMLRIQMMYTDKHFQRWNFTDMSLPVIFRTFTQNGNPHSMRVIGFIKKDDMSPKAIIYYLPLEYKMDIIGREKSTTPSQFDW